MLQAKMKKPNGTKRILKSIFNAVFVISLLIMSHAQAAKPIYSGGKERAAIRGYDPVAYFTANKAMKGSNEFQFKFKGAKWLFASQVNLDKFKANPDKYTPQYGGYCAYAVSNGSVASIKPEFFTIHNEKLYLNYSKSVYRKWVKKKDDYIEQANKEWPTLLSK